MAYEFGVDVIPVQHHHAHAVALANDHEVDEMIVIAADGTGYGDDHTSWGGEILYTDIKDYERMAHLERQKMPGGDLGTRYPIRMLLSILKDEKMIKNYVKHFDKFRQKISPKRKPYETHKIKGQTSSSLH